MSISLKLNRHLNNLGYYLSEGYLLFPTVPRNVGSITSVNEHEHFKDRLTIWLCTKSFKFNCLLADLKCQHTSWCSSHKSREFSMWLDGIEQVACRRLQRGFPTNSWSSGSSKINYLKKMSVNTIEKAPVLTSTFWYKLKLSPCL